MRRLSSSTAARAEPMDPTPELLTVRDLAAYLRRSPQSIYVARSRGQLPPAVKVAGRLLWRRAMIDAWLDSLSE